MLGHDREADCEVPAAAGAIPARSAGANGPQRATALGGVVCAWSAAGRRPEIDRADGRPVAEWERAGDAAVRRAEPLGVGGSLGAAGKADDGGVGNRIRPGLWTTPGFPNKARIPWV